MSKEAVQAKDRKSPPRSSSCAWHRSWGRRLSQRVHNMGNGFNDSNWVASMWFFGSSHTDPPDRICKQPFNQDESCMVRSHWRKCQPCHSSSWNRMSRDRPSHLWMLIRLIPTSCDCDNIATTCRQRQHGCRLELMQGRRAAARARPFAETTGGLLRTVWTCADSAAVHKVSEVTYRNLKCFFLYLSVG